MRARKSKFGRRHLKSTVWKMRMYQVLSAGLMVLVAAVLFGQHTGGTHQMAMSQGAESPLTAPGNAVFGAVQEVIATLDADPATDWSQVDIERLREHLVDMNRVAIDVKVVSAKKLADGLQVQVEPVNAAAHASLQRVLAAHPPMLHRETGWRVRVDSLGQDFRLTVTTTNPAEVAKIQGLGYFGLLAYGAHHRRHHWMIATGQHPHQAMQMK